MAQKPTSVTIFSYNVGFGDCFLVRFAYGTKQRHILIDFGTTALPKNAPKDQLTRIARDIERRCEGKLQAVIATHRHADHISGFATNAAGNAPGDIILGLNVDVVVQPWTEQLDLDIDALGPAVGSAKGLAGFHRSLNTQHLFARSVVRMLDEGGLKWMAPAARDRLRFLGEDNIKNVSAVKNLAAMGRKNVYAFHGSDSGLTRVLPGVRTHVLGPPTLKQTDTIRRQKARDEDEFWHLALKNLGADEEFDERQEELFPGAPVWPRGQHPHSIRWFANKLKQARSDQLLSIVTALDKQMNNTSLILLFEVGGKKLLFPGDAQIENWRYALQQERVLKMLADVDVYKVGHHGSLNATPKTLWNRFEKKGGKSRPGRLTSLLSTMTGKHGSEEKRTEVPRRTLLKELRDHSHLHSTQQIGPSKLCSEVTISLV
ncbi:MBL fold metallo-hydrolase [Dongia sp.]|uniref:MBL fold metallo-hydrolase n=1 Tax=Dongia sp. TaxID=1977262 RepID=UPI0035B49353